MKVPTHPNELVFEFCADNLFPLTSVENAQRQAAKTHAAAVDRHLGFDIESCEKIIRGHASRYRVDLETWNHINPQIFLTSYLELLSLLDFIHPKQHTTLIDLGCGYARIPFILETHYPDVSFIGYEAVKERVAESQRVLNTHKIPGEVLCQDLSEATFGIPQAQYYFVYDCGTREDVEITLNKLLKNVLSEQDPTLAIIARGERVIQYIKNSHELLQRFSATHFNNVCILKRVTSQLGV